MRPEPREPWDSALESVGGGGEAKHIRAALGKFLLTVDKQTSEVQDPNMTKKG